MELSHLLQDDLLRFCESSEDSDYSFDLDQLLATALEEYESQSESRPASETPNPAQLPCSPTPKSRFAAPKTARDIQEARRQGVPKKTQQDTSYCVRVWEQWRNYRRETCGDIIPALTDITPSNRGAAHSLKSRTLLVEIFGNLD